MCLKFTSNKEMEKVMRKVRDTDLPQIICASFDPVLRHMIRKMKENDNERTKQNKARFI